MKMVDRLSRSHDIGKYSVLLMYRGLLSPSNSRKTAIACPRGRGMALFHEFLLWPQFYLWIYYAVCSIVLYCTLIYCEFIVPHFMHMIYKHYKDATLVSWFTGSLATMLFVHHFFLLTKMCNITGPSKGQCSSNWWIPAQRASNMESEHYWTFVMDSVRKGQ